MPKKFYPEFWHVQVSCLTIIHLHINNVLMNNFSNYNSMHAHIHCLHQPSTTPPTKINPNTQHCNNINNHPFKSQLPPCQTTNTISTMSFTELNLTVMAVLTDSQVETCFVWRVTHLWAIREKRMIVLEWWIHWDLFQNGALTAQRCH